MATHITQIDSDGAAVTILRVEGEMTIADARLIERLARDVRTETGNAVTIDLADLDFLDSESASVLKGLDDQDGFDIVGMEIFLQNAVNEAERR